MHALDIGSINEDLGEGLGIGQAFDLLRIDLEGDDGRFAVALRLVEIIGAQDGAHKIFVAPDDAVLVEVGNLRKGRLDLAAQRLGLGLIADSRDRTTRRKAGR